MDFSQLCQYCNQNSEKMKTLLFLDKTYIHCCNYPVHGVKLLKKDGKLEIHLPNTDDALYEKYIMKYKNECFKFMNVKYDIPIENMAYTFINEDNDASYYCFSITIPKSHYE